MVVSPHPRGVDRNASWAKSLAVCTKSPLTRGEWIEIDQAQCRSWLPPVSPHPRGVDRNIGATASPKLAIVSPHPRGVDRNPQEYGFGKKGTASPLTRGEWIEMKRRTDTDKPSRRLPSPEGSG